MKTLIKQALLWIRDRFSFLFTVCFRLCVGEKKKENPNKHDGGKQDENSW